MIAKIKALEDLWEKMRMRPTLQPRTRLKFPVILDGVEYRSSGEIFDALMNLKKPTEITGSQVHDWFRSVDRG